MIYVYLNLYLQSGISLMVKYNVIEEIRKISKFFKVSLNDLSWLGLFLYSDTKFYVMLVISNILKSKLYLCYW